MTQNLYRVLTFGCCTILLLAFSNQSRGAALRPGDIVVVTQVGGRIYVVDPATGSTTIVSAGNLLFTPMQLVIDDQGKILTAERTGGNRRGIVRIDPATGSQQFVSSGFTYPVALDFGLNDNLFVADLGDEGLHEVDLATGAKRPVAGLSGVNPNDVEVEASGKVLVADFGSFGIQDGRVLRIDPATGTRSVLATGFMDPSDLALSSVGDIYVSNRHDGGTTIVHVNPATGAKTNIVELPQEGFITLENDQTLLYGNFYGGVSRVDLRTGLAQTIAPDYLFYRDITGIAVYHPVPEPSTVVMLGVGLVGLVAIAKRRCR